MHSKKYNKPVNVAKKKQTHRYRERSSRCQWEERRCRGVRGTSYEYKTSYKDVLYNAGNIANT